MSSYPVNQFAPEGMAGKNQPPVESVGYEDKPYDYIYNPPNGGVLTANQLINPDSLAIQSDADFIAYGYYIATATGSFQVQFIDSTGYQMMEGMINSAAISSSSSDPTVLSPGHPFPAGGKLLIVIQDLSGAPNTIQLVIKGVKRFRVQPQA